MVGRYVASVMMVHQESTSVRFGTQYACICRGTVQSYCFVVIVVSIYPPVDLFANTKSVTTGSRDRTNVQK